jgi:hypothetical protein
MPNLHHSPLTVRHKLDSDVGSVEPWLGSPEALEAWRAAAAFSLLIAPCLVEDKQVTCGVAGI